MTKELQTKCKTCFGGPRMILHALWKNTFFLLQKSSVVFSLPSLTPLLVKDRKEPVCFRNPSPSRGRGWWGNLTANPASTLTICNNEHDEKNHLRIGAKLSNFFLETFSITVFKVPWHNYLIQVNELLKVFSVVGSGDYLEVAFLVPLVSTVQSVGLPTEQKKIHHPNLASLI